MTQLSDEQRSPLVSIVAPCCNEESNIEMLCGRVCAAARAEAGDLYELILVDDGSTDGTWNAIKKMHSSNERIRGLRLSRNYGHQLALTAGLAAARGARIMMIDADLQDPPELLGEMMRVIDSGADVAYGQRRRRVGETLFKRLSAGAFYHAISALCAFNLPRNTGDFRLVTRRVLDDFLAMPERHRFVRGMIAWVGYKQVAVMYDRDKRHAGTTKYTLGKMLRFAADAITSFSISPLRMAGIMSFAAFLIAGLAIMYVLYGVLAGEAIPGWASVVVAVSFFSGAQLLSTAIIGEYLGRLYIESKGRPLYLISEKVEKPSAARNQIDWSKVRDEISASQNAAIPDAGYSVSGR